MLNLNFEFEFEFTYPVRLNLCASFELVISGNLLDTYTVRRRHDELVVFVTLADDYRNKNVLWILGLHYQPSEPPVEEACLERQICKTNEFIEKCFSSEYLKLRFNYNCVYVSVNMTFTYNYALFVNTTLLIGSKENYFPI